MNGRGVAARCGAILCAMLGAASVMSAGGAASATGAAESVLFVREPGAADVLRRPGVDGATLTVGVGTTSYSGNTAQVIYFGSQVGNQFSTLVSVEISTGLGAGTYDTTRLAGQGKPILDVSTAACGDGEPGTLHIAEATYDESGKPTVFAASFDVENCGGEGTIHGEIRWKSANALGLAHAPDLSQITDPIQVNSTAELPLVYTAAGNGPTTLGLATLHQTPLWDGSVYWSVVADGCSGHVLQPGQTCTIMLRFAPKRPNGYPQGTIGGWVSLPDGQSIPARAAIQAKVVPLPGQPVGLVAHGAFRHFVLTWSPPPVYLGNWQYSPAASLTYHIYRVLPGGSREAVADTQHTFLVIPGLSDDFTGTYLVTASQAGTAGPDSVPGAGTTATSEALVADFYGGLMNRRLAPSPETAFSDFYGSGVYGGAGSEYEDLAVSRDESVLALTYEYAHESPMLHSSVLTTRVDGTTGAGFTTVPAADSSPAWDIDPALSPNGSHIVFTHADQAGDLTELRIASTAPGAIASTVPGSAGLSDAAFSADGNAVVAVQPFENSTRLVRLDLSTGELTPLEGTTGLGQPDVAADGRIVATIGTDQTHPDASGLVIYDAGTITVIAAAQSGTNCHPEFSATGARVFYRHSDTTAACDRLPTNALDLATGTTESLTSDSFASTAYVLHADGAHDADTTAPAPRLTAPTGAATLADSVTARWSASDPKVQGAATSGVGSYDVRYRSATASHGFGSYHAWLTGTRLTSATLPVAIGTQYCLSVRARDLEDNTSAWSTERCFAKPLDDRALTTAATRLASTNFYRGTYTRAAATGATLHRENATADRIGIVVGTCPECGRVDVWLAGKYLGRLNTHTATTLYRRILWLPVFAQRSGRLVIKSTSAAPVRIDGVVSLRSAT